MFSHYGTLYVITTRDGNKYQFEFDSKQFMDEQDREVDLSEVLEEYPSIIEAFKDDDDFMESIPLSTKYEMEGIDNDEALEQFIKSNNFDMEDKNTIIIQEYSDLQDFISDYTSRGDNLYNLIELVDDADNLDDFLDLENLSLQDMHNIIPERNIKDIEDVMRNKIIKMDDLFPEAPAQHFYDIKEYPKLYSELKFLLENELTLKAQEDLEEYFEELLEDKDYEGGLLDRGYGYLVVPKEDKHKPVMERRLQWEFETNMINELLYGHGTISDDMLYDIITRDNEDIQLIKGKPKEEFYRNVDESRLANTIDAMLRSVR